MPHDVAHEEILDRVLVGDLAPHAPEVDALRGSCGECRARLVADGELEHALGDADDEVAELLAKAERGPAPGEAEALAGFRATVGLADQRGWRGRRGALLALFATAAAVLAIVLLRARPDPAGDGRGPSLTGGVVECLAPVGDAEGETEFRWRARTPASARFTLRAFDAEERLLFAAEGLREPRYTPTVTERDKLIGTVRWEVLALDATEVILGSGDAVARFSR